jgi:two-component system sensor histidine kinase TctE
MKSSLRQGLNRWLLPAMLLALGISVATAYGVGQRAAALAYDQALMATAEDLALGLHFAAHQPRFELSAQSERMLRSDVRDAIFFVVRNEAGGFLAGDADLPGLPPTQPGKASSSELTFRHQPVRALSIRFDQAEQPYVITVAETLGKRRDMVRAILASMLLPAAGVLALVALAAWLAVRQGLRPLAVLEQALHSRAPGQMVPLDMAQVPLELHSLVATLNGLLGRLEQATRAQQAFVADAAHQLRTPLAGLQSQIELLPRVDASNFGLAVEGLAVTTRRAIRLANQLLALSRSERDQATLQCQAVDLAGLVEAAADDWVHRAIAARIDLGFELAPAPLQGDGLLLHEMMQNLLDNALAYAGPDCVVTVATGSDRHHAWFSIDDSGPGIAPEQREQVFGRFWRAPGSPGDGSGLGLAIVRQIALQHGGAVEVSASALGGARLVVRLPRAAAPR